MDNGVTLLLTGATGFLGSHVTRALVEAGYAVVILKRSASDTRRIGDLLSRLRTYDIDQVGLQQVFDESSPIRAVIHLATCYGRHGETAEEIIQANIAFPVKMLEEAASHGVPLFLNADTYFTKAGVDFGYLSGYTLSKRQFLEWARQCVKARAIEFVNLRLEHLYGPDDDEAKFVMQLAKACLSQEPEWRLTQGEQVRDFIHVHDAVSAFRLLLDRATRGERLDEHYDIGTGQSCSVREMAKTVHRLTDSMTKLLFGALPYRQGDLMYSVADAEPLKRLGWQPRYTLEQGLRDTVQWYRSRTTASLHRTAH